jgi:hypothetical protein
LPARASGHEQEARRPPLQRRVAPCRAPARLVIDGRRHPVPGARGRELARGKGLGRHEDAEEDPASEGRVETTRVSASVREGDFGSVPPSGGAGTRPRASGATRAESSDVPSGERRGERTGARGLRPDARLVVAGRISVRLAARQDRNLVRGTQGRLTLQKPRHTAASTPRPRRARLRLVDSSAGDGR